MIEFLVNNKDIITIIYYIIGTVVGVVTISKFIMWLLDNRKEKEERDKLFEYYKKLLETYLTAVGNDLINHKSDKDVWSEIVNSMFAIQAKYTITQQSDRDIIFNILAKLNIITQMNRKIVPTPNHLLNDFIKGEYKGTIIQKTGIYYIEIAKLVSKGEFDNLIYECIKNNNK